MEKIKLKNKKEEYLMSRGKSLFLGFVVGGTVGAVTTLLSAPSSGKEFRRRMKQQGEEWKERADKLLQDSLRLKDQITETSKEGIALIYQLTQEMQESIQDWKTAVEPHQDNIYDYLEQIEISLKELEAKVEKNSK